MTKIGKAQGTLQHLAGTVIVLRFQVERHSMHW